MSRWASLVMFGAFGCYAPVVPSEVPCGPGAACPGDQLCDFGRPTPVCVDQLGDGGGIADSSRQVDSALVDAGADARTLPAGLVMWLRMDDAPGDGVIDSAGNHAATCTSCPTQVAGHIDMAYDFTADRIDVPDANDLRPNTGFTTTAWIKVDAVASEGVVICKEVQATNASYWLSVITSPPRIFLYTEAGTVNGTTTITLNTWHHVAMTWDGATLRGYVNGVQDAMTARPTIASDAGPVQIGGYHGGDRLDGSIDHVMFFDHALLASEIAQLASQ